MASTHRYGDAKVERFGCGWSIFIWRFDHWMRDRFVYSTRQAARNDVRLSASK